MSIALETYGVDMCWW